MQKPEVMVLSPIRRDAMAMAEAAFTLLRADKAEDAEDFTRIDGQVDVVQHLMRFGATAIAFVQMVDLNRHNVLFLLMFHNKNAAG